ncbi:MAG: hypothetical protein HC812_20060 [Leptolyngbya sp. RL_3_1]|nr:hypothetical protein [Leptolyngbya sp. RL_3_1]
MINELTPEQEALLPVYRDKWMAIGLSTEPCDRSAAESAARAAYEVAGLEPPKQFVWFDRYP